MGKTMFDLRKLPVIEGAGFAAGVNVSALVGVVANANLPAYSSYTPTLTASSSNPTLGTGTAVGRYTQVGHLVHAEGQIAFGASGMNKGSGTYRVSLPVTAAVPYSGAIIGTAWIVDISAVASATPAPMFDGSVTSYFVFAYPATWPSGGITGVTDTAPWTWAASDQISWSIVYEAA